MSKRKTVIATGYDSGGIRSKPPQVSQRYGDVSAVDKLSFTVRDGEVVGLLGPSGARLLPCA